MKIKKWNENKIPIQNARNGKIFYTSVKEIDKELKQHKKHTIQYKGFALVVEKGPLNSFNGYVVKFPKKLSSTFSENEQNNLAHIKGVYVPHGGYTSGNGFDCAHHDDFLYIKDLTTQMSSAKSWKTPKYVESELKKIANSLLAIANK